MLVNESKKYNPTSNLFFQGNIFPSINSATICLFALVNSWQSRVTADLMTVMDMVEVNPKLADVTNSDITANTAGRIITSCLGSRIV